MKPEEYPRETSCKYMNIVTGVLELFERFLFQLKPDFKACFAQRMHFYTLFKAIYQFSAFSSCTLQSDKINFCTQKMDRFEQW